MKTFYKTLEIKTDQNNLLELEPKLAPHVEDFDYFFITDLTKDSQKLADEAGFKNGLITFQTMHTTCVLSVNELDEPCLLGDINKFLREQAPKTKPYFHNSGMRTKNLCADDHKCDRNADAHLKAFHFGSPTQTLIIKNGEILYGQWQRLCMIDLDGPRTRRLEVQIIGE